MFSTRVSVFVCATALGLGVASVARAQDFVNFTYGNLSGSFDAGSLLFTAIDDQDSNGAVSRNVAPNGTAFFSIFSGLASFELEMSLSSLSSSTAQAMGTIDLVDIDGDTFTGNLNGQWNNVGGSATFHGLLQNVVPSNTSGDGTYDGDTGSFSMSFPAPPPYEGAAVILEFGSWFTDGSGSAQSFARQTTQASGAFVPEPATLALLGIGGMLAVSRRRRAV